jgi:hypothetical protein
LVFGLAPVTLLRLLRSKDRLQEERADARLREHLAVAASQTLPEEASL